MENLSPSVTILSVVRRSIEQSKPLRATLSTIGSQFDVLFADQIHRILNKDPLEMSYKLSPLKRAILLTLEKGLSGQTIYSNILELEAEAIQELTNEMDAHAKKVPMKMLIPLFVFLFPAFSVLLYVLVTQTILL